MRPVSPTLLFSGVRLKFLQPSKETRANDYARFQAQFKAARPIVRDMFQKHRAELENLAGPANITILVKPVLSKNSLVGHGDEDEADFNPMFCIRGSVGKPPRLTVGCDAALEVFVHDPEEVDDQEWLDERIKELFIDPVKELVK